MMNTQQMELGLAVVVGQMTGTNSGRPVRSDWWFRQMRKAVDMAGGFRGDSGQENEMVYRPNFPPSYSFMND